MYKKNAISKEFLLKWRFLFVCMFRQPVIRRTHSLSYRSRMSCGRLMNVSVLAKTLLAG